MKDPTAPLYSTLILFFIFSLLPWDASPLPLNSLSRGFSLSLNDEESQILVSPNESFTCGFYKVGTNAYTFSIWFPKSDNKTLAWTANRDYPVNGHGSRITFRKDGSLVLTDVDGTVVWSTTTRSTAADRMQLLDTGNLVIVDTDGTTLWQSYDSPTDTLLPMQPITKSVKLVSSTTKGSASSGYYGLYFDTNNVLTMVYDGPEISSIYWPNPDLGVFVNGRTHYNSSRYGVLDEEGQFVASDGFAFNASDMGLGIRRRLTLDYDGNLRLYSLNESSGLWSISWEALPQLCQVHGLCGRNGICVYAPMPQCSCPPGYEMTNATNWNEGCKRKIDVSCDNHQHFKYLSIPNSDFWGYELNYTQSLSLKECEKICSQDCQCNAFSYREGSGECWPKGELFNGKTVPGAQINVYLKVGALVEASDPSTSQLFQPACDTKATEIGVKSSVMYGVDLKFKRPYLYWFVGAFFVVEVLFITFGWWFILRRGHIPPSLEEGYRQISSQFKKFTYKELERATGKFKDVLGRGGSGVVYKGVLDDERAVAVKKLEDANLGEEEFWAEVSVIGRIYHMNLVRMWGYCSERAHKLLVSEHIENGSLEKVLFNAEEGDVLGWKERFKIAVGVAKGLAYLHHECLEWVIHCDVKPENILLDRDFEPKIADFGLAKLLNRGGGGSNLSHIRGTRGYIAPEWASNLPITGKVDVYSYGVVLLEIVKGGRVSDWVMDWVDGEEIEMIIRRLCQVLKEKLQGGDKAWIENFVDCKLNGEFNRTQARMMVEIAVSCVEEETIRRPTMDSVVRMLLSSDDEGEIVIL